MSEGKMDTSSLTQVLNQGFSLVEMLVVIAIIGVMAAIAIPNMVNVSDASKIAVAQNKARNIAGVFSSGRTAGAPKFLSVTSVRGAQNAVGQGDYGAVPFENMIFQIPGTTDAADDALTVPRYKTSYYLTWANGRLEYDKNGGYTN